MSSSASVDARNCIGENRHTTSRVERIARRGRDAVVGGSLTNVRDAWLLTSSATCLHVFELGIVVDSVPRHHPSLSSFASALRLGEPRAQVTVMMV